MHEAIHTYASPHAYVRVNRICIFFFPKTFHPFSLYAGRFFQTILIGLTSFAQSFPELCLKFYQIHLLLAEGLSQKRDKAKVFLYEISDEPGFLEPNKNSWTSCSYNYRVSEGRVGYKIKEEMI